MYERQPIRVLVVDDSLIFLRVAARFLARLTRITILGTAMDGHEGLKRAVELHPDVVITDLHMPGMSGLDLLRRLKAELPNAGLIVLTMYASPEVEAAALARGADAFVSKVDLVDELEQAVLEVAERKRGEQDPE